MNWERFAIVGTAQSWVKTPWTDPGLTIASVNDAYRMPKFVRADIWYDIHPLDKFFVPPADGKIMAHQVPVGYYCRPADHKEWLGRQAQTIPVVLHPDYLTQYEPAKDWPKAIAFPKAQIEEDFGRYFTSSPAWMMAHAILHGAKEIHIYGIHLATEHEYIEQRPNFEYLCGRVLGPSKVTKTVMDGLRRYETKDGLIVLPEASPILSSDFQYGFQPRPRAKLEPLKWELHKLQIKRDRAIQELAIAPWWKLTGSTKAEYQRLTLLQQDVQEQMARMQAGV